MTARLLEEPADFLATQGPGLSEISHFLAVYSCKGGVGKSTVAVNLALELARMGGRVGLLDLDLYGPSLPVLWQPQDAAIRRSDKGKGMILPIEEAGVKFLSLGFVNRNSGVPGSGTENGAAIMRGPMAGKVAEQLIKGTDWGPLDVLVLDLPPGTGDVQLQVCQDLSLSGAVAVTTPSKLALVDTRKGIEMFTSLGVPTLAVVQNMSYFEVSGCYLFTVFVCHNAIEQAQRV
jgi:Mrp family chromosome partitioning ATPase